MLKECFYWPKLGLVSDIIQGGWDRPPNKKDNTTMTTPNQNTAISKAICCLRPLPIDSFLKLLSSTQGRDKLYRLLQYFSRFLAFYLGKMSPSMEFVKRLQKLSLSLGMARKLFRVGKPLDNLQIILKSSSLKDEIEKSFVIGKAIGFGSWLTLDTFQWLNSQGVLVLNPSVAKVINENAPRFWLLGLISSLSLNLYKIHRLHPQSMAALQLKPAQLPQILKEIDGETRQVAKDALQDLVDLIIPLSLTGSLQVSPGVVGAAGTFTSILALTTLWK